MASESSGTFNQLQIIVHYNPDNPKRKITFSGPGINDLDQIHVPQGMALIVLVCEPAMTEQGLVGKFPSHPIQWIDADRQPVVPPSNLTVHRVNDYNVTIQVMNTSLLEHEIHFFVLVQDAQDFHGTDPSIVNLPPTGGKKPPKPLKKGKDKKKKSNSKS